MALRQGYGYVTLFFELSPKTNYEVLGYPELLLEKPIKSNQYSEQFSYAKYANGRLMMHSGTFPYAFDPMVYGNTSAEFRFFESDGFDHVIYNPDNENSIVVSVPTINPYNILVSFTYIFIFFLVMITLLLVFSNPYTKMIDIQFTIKNKVVFSIMLILLLSAVFVAGGIIYYTINQFEQSRFDIMTDKIQSVLVETEQRLSDFDDIHEVSPEYLNNLLINFSNIFYTDVNLYDLKGDLVATSRKEIFERKLTSRKINAIAYRELVLNKKARIVQKENIGNLVYYSAYVPFINASNQLLAYLNIPYFAKETPLRQELMRVSVAVINIYAILVLFSILIAVYLSNRITKPLRIVQQRIHDIGLEKTNQRVEYNGKDEIAELVHEYNRMLDELGKSAALLAKSERESAWREMARQVAHEIKNPLTPMKLSVQLLERSQRNNDPDFDERFNKVTNTLIEQIDSLSSIASAFSQFAKMPEARTEPVDIAERIRQSVQLFRESTQTKVVFDFPDDKKVLILADNERMLQVFNNLIKNAIQSIPKNREGKIYINLRQQRNRAIVEIKDNGVGITPEMEQKLFQPNFTTKTSGTGLGLAIVKNIVEEAEGAIWFISKPQKGTSFYVSFPIAKGL
jgi:signal transduction histidine kinase